MENLISIITPVYNSAEFLSETIESVINQTYNNWELLLIDDLSTDNSVEIINNYSKIDHRVKLIALKINGGAGIARNEGLKAAKGEFTAFLDSDDVWLENKLDAQLNYMLENNYACTYTWYWNTNSIGERESYFVTPKSISFFRLKYNNYILTSTLMCKSSAIKGIEFSQMRKRQDWVYFLDILKNVGSAHSIEKCLVEYRKSDNSLSSNKMKLVSANLSIIGDYFYPKDKWKAYLHFMVFIPVYLQNKIFNKKSIKK